MSWFGFLAPDWARGIGFLGSLRHPNLIEQNNAEVRLYLRLAAVRCFNSKGNLVEMLKDQ